MVPHKKGVLELVLKCATKIGRSFFIFLDECKDLGTADYCAKYKAYCKNEVAGSTISHNCRKTCGVCKGRKLISPFQFHDPINTPFVCYLSEISIHSIEKSLFEGNSKLIINRYFSC